MQTDRELAEMAAKFRTPPGFSWQDLANDIELLMKHARESGIPPQSAEKPRASIH